MQNIIPYSSHENYQAHCLFIGSSHEWNYKSDSECFPKGKEVAIESHRTRVLVNKDKHTRVFECKKHLTEFLGLKGHSLQFGIGGFPLKLFCLTIVTDRQWELELPNLISDEGSSELNGKT